MSSDPNYNCDSRLVFPAQLVAVTPIKDRSIVCSHFETFTIIRIELYFQVDYRRTITVNIVRELWRQLGQSLMSYVWNRVSLFCRCDEVTCQKSHNPARAGAISSFIPRLSIPFAGGLRAEAELDGKNEEGFVNWGEGLTKGPPSSHSSPDLKLHM